MKHFDGKYFSSGWYSDYLEDYKERGAFYAKRLIEILRPKRSWKFLDVGCGMGGMILSLRQFRYKAFGVEISDFCLQNSLVKPWLIKANILNLPFKKEEFEVVTCVDVLEYIKKNEIERAITNLAKITQIFLFIEAITQFSPNASQKINPDSNREKQLPTAGEIIRMAERRGMIALGRILTLKETIDFNCLFLKNKKANRKYLIRFWKESRLF